MTKSYLFVATSLALLVSGAACAPAATPEPDPEGVASLRGELGATSTQVAEADVFATEEALVAHWYNQPWVVRTQIFLDGAKVIDTPGFGPAYVEQYFRCSTTNDVRKICGSHDDGSATLEHLVDLMPGVGIYYENQLIQVPEHLAMARIVTCTGDQSVYGPVQFKWVSHFNLFFGPLPPERDCP
jgi:hypothetical protein